MDFAVEARRGAARRERQSRSTLAAVATHALASLVGAVLVLGWRNGGGGWVGVGGENVGVVPTTAVERGAGARGLKGLRVGIQGTTAAGAEALGHGVARRRLQDIWAAGTERMDKMRATTLEDHPLWKPAGTALPVPSQQTTDDTLVWMDQGAEGKVRAMPQHRPRRAHDVTFLELRISL
jgi:hypothetical protein